MSESALVYKTNYQLVRSDSDIRDAIKTLKVNRPANPTLSYAGPKAQFVRSQWNSAEYDLFEYGRIIDTESFVSRAFLKKRTLIFKQGFYLESKNSEHLKYINQRLREIGYMSKKPFTEILRDWAYNLVSVHNAYVIKVRNEDASSGKPRPFRGGELKPVAAYFIAAPETMEHMINEAGEPVKFRQIINSHYRMFEPHNVIHHAYTRRTGYLVGTPPLEAVKDDILALRRIEESVESLIYKAIFPIIHVKVGTESKPAKTLPDGTREVDVATRLLQDIEQQGGLVTSERVEIKAIGVESLALRVESYLAHFKKRVYAGLGMSGIDFGDDESTGRATGEVLSSSLVDSCKDYQSELAELVTCEIFDELLMETGKYNFPFDIPEDDRVYLKFNEITLEEKIKKESHILNLANGNMITTDEARLAMGRKTLDDAEYDELHDIAINKIKKDEELKMQKAIITTQAKVAPAPAPGGAKKPASSSSKSTKTTSSGNVKSKNTKSEGAKKAAQATTKPKNQYTDSEILKERITLLLNNTKSLQRISLSAHRQLVDYATRKLSFGIVDANEYLDPKLNKDVEIMTGEMILQLIDQRDSPNKFRRLASTLVDKLEAYINTCQ